MNKKCIFLLLPAVAMIITGCKSNNKKSKEEENKPNQMEVDFEEVKNLSYDENFEDGLGDPVPADQEEDLLDRMRAQFRNYSVKMTYTRVNYQAIVQGQTDEQIERHVYNFYTNDVYSHEEDRYNLWNDYSDDTKEESLVIKSNDSFYKSEKQQFIEHIVLDGSHSIERTDCSEYAEEQINELRKEPFEDAYSYFFIYLSNGEFYETENGYVYYSAEKRNVEMYETTDYYQVIFEFDKSLRLIKKTVLDDQKSKFDFVNGVDLDEQTYDMYEHIVVRAEYGTRKNGNILINEIENQFNKPYIEMTMIYFDEIDNDKVYWNYEINDRVEPQKAHVEVAIYFDDMCFDELNVSQELVLFTQPNMYEDDLNLVRCKDELEIKNGEGLHYQGKKLMFLMSSKQDVLFFNLDYELVDGNKGQLISGSVTVTTLDEYKNLFTH